MRQWAASHDIHYKLKILTPAFPTFKPAQTFLDLCLADSRLAWLDDLNERAQTLPYDSDHAAISLTFEIQNEAFILNGPPCQGIKYNYKATKWDKFKQKVIDLYVRDIPFDSNLSIAEIEDHLQYITSIIVNTVAVTIPACKYTDSVNKYINHKIRKIQKNKRYVVSLLHKLHIIDPSAHLEITRMAKSALRK